jgi:TIR domain
MKVFLSWSGLASKSAAEALREWLPNVIQAIDPWMSAEDIEKGSLWSSEIAEKLSSTKAGITCVTPDNQDAPWLNFEAGALSRTVERTMVCTYLIGMRPPELKGPLVRFQASEANKTDTLRLLRTLNKALEGQALSETKLVGTFERWWPDLEAKLASVVSAKRIDEAVRPPQDMLEEILTLVRELTMESKTERARNIEALFTLKKRDPDNARFIEAIYQSVRRALSGVDKQESEEEHGS